MGAWQQSSAIVARPWTCWKFQRRLFSSLLKKVSGTLESPRQPEKSEVPESSRHFFQQAVRHATPGTDGTHGIDASHAFKKKKRGVKGDASFNSRRQPILPPSLLEFGSEIGLVDRSFLEPAAFVVKAIAPGMFSGELFFPANQRADAFGQQC